VVDDTDTDTDTRLDVVVPHARTDDGDGVHVIRLREVDGDDENETKRVVELGEVRPLAEGRAIHHGAEIVRMRRRGDSPAYDVDVIVPRERTALSGPAQVASETYRRNWSATFEN
jgi:hypothetical protein